MTITSDEDLLTMLEDFGQIITIAGNPITAIFADTAEDSLGMASSGPRIKCRAVDVPAVVVGDTVVVGSDTYLVAEPVRPRVRRLVSVKLRAT